MSRPYIGDADQNYVRMSLTDFGKVATILKSVGYVMVPGRKNGRGSTKLYRLIATPGQKQPSKLAEELVRVLVGEMSHDEVKRRGDEKWSHPEVCERCALERKAQEILDNKGESDETKA